MTIIIEENVIKKILENIDKDIKYTIKSKQQSHICIKKEIKANETNKVMT